VATATEVWGRVQEAGKQWSAIAGLATVVLVAGGFVVYRTRLRALGVPGDAFASTSLYLEWGGKLILVSIALGLLFLLGLGLVRPLFVRASGAAVWSRLPRPLRAALKTLLVLWLVVVAIDAFQLYAVPDLLRAAGPGERSILFPSPTCLAASGDIELMTLWMMTLAGSALAAGALALGRLQDKGVGDPLGLLSIVLTVHLAVACFACLSLFALEAERLQQVPTGLGDVREAFVLHRDASKAVVFGRDAAGAPVRRTLDAKDVGASVGDTVPVGRLMKVNGC
jgi:hypothetical protein